jgi:hypothetical protein
VSAIQGHFKTHIKELRCGLRPEIVAAAYDFSLPHHGIRSAGTCERRGGIVPCGCLFFLRAGNRLLLIMSSVARRWSSNDS